MRLHVREAFFHCSKYIQTRVAGLTVPRSPSSQQSRFPQDLLKGSQRGLSEEHCGFLSQQVLCFLCTVNQEGQCAVNHRGGAPDFLVPFPHSKATPEGAILLPDYTGNGAFEAVGNILETNRHTRCAELCRSGGSLYLWCSTHRGAGKLAGSRDTTLRRSRADHSPYGAARRGPSGDWSATLDYECARAASIWTNTHVASTCALK